MPPARLPPAVGPLKGRLALRPYQANREILCGRRLLADQAAGAVPNDVIRSCPTVAGTEPLAILNRDRRFDSVVQSPHRPAVVRLARRQIALRLAIQKHIWSRNARLERKSVPRVAGRTALNE